MKLKKLFGDKRFYAALAAIVLPIMLQNGITQFVSVLDNLMVGRIGEEQMSGVSIVNQILFVFNLCLFGGVSGAGIFTAQYYGSHNHQGVRYTVRFKFYLSLVICIIGYAVFLTAGDQLISLFLNESESGGDIELAFASGKEYLLAILPSLVFYAITQVYASTLRETGDTLLPMIASGCAVAINLIFNYLLIFGKFGFPELGVRGAAIATLISRIVEMLIVIIFSHTRMKKFPYLHGLFRSFKIPLGLVKEISIKGIPLLINEAMWSLGMTFMAQCYSTRGMDAVAGYSICSTISNLFNIVFISMGSAIAIMIGNRLGAGDIEGARREATWHITASTVLSIGVAVMMASLSGFFPTLYNTSDSVRSIASELILVSSLFMPVGAFINACYFIIRSGGNTLVTVIFDSVFVWCISVPTALILSRVTNIPIIPLYIICLSLDLLKVVSGAYLVHKGSWAKNIVDSKK